MPYVVYDVTIGLFLVPHQNALSKKKGIITHLLNCQEALRFTKAKAFLFRPRKLIFFHQIFPNSPR